MPEPTEEKEVTEEPIEEQVEPSAETKKTEKKPDHMIPKTRLDEEIAKRAQAEKELEKFRKAEEDRKKSELSELDRLKLEKTEADKRASDAEQSVNELKLKTAFRDVADELGIEFANPQAREDAFTFLDKKVAGEDGAGMKKALEDLEEKRPHLLKPEESEPETDAKKRGTRTTSTVLAKEKETELTQRFRLRKPR